jgi:hypothetical protein
MAHDKIFNTGGGNNSSLNFSAKREILLWLQHKFQSGFKPGVFQVWAQYVTALQAHFLNVGIIQFVQSC